MYRLIFFFFIYIQFANGQTYNDSLNYQKVDSITYSLYLSKSWIELNQIGQCAIKAGIDYPNLRLRLADASIALNHPSKALHHLNYAYKADATQSYMIKQYIESHKILFNDDLARFYLSKTDSVTQRIYNQSKLKLIDEIFLDGGIIVPNDSVRNNLNVFRIGIQSRLNWKWTIYQTYQYYEQSSTVKSPPPPPPAPRRPNITTLPLSQWDYFLLTRYQISRNYSGAIAYHFLQSNNNSFLETGYGGYINLRRTFPYWTINLDAGFSDYSHTHQQQIGLAGKVYPLGNSSWYINGGINYLNNSDSGYVSIGNLGTGIKLHNFVWTEFNFTSGELSNYAENSGEYIYNSLDLTINKFDAILNLFLKNHLTIYFDYRIEQKKQFVNNSNVIYNQQGLIGGLLWKF